MIKVGDYIKITENQSGIKFWYTTESFLVVGIKLRVGDTGRDLEVDKDIQGQRFLWEGYAELDVKKNREEKLKRIFND